MRIRKLAISGLILTLLATVAGADSPADAITKAAASIGDHPGASPSPGPASPAPGAGPSPGPWKLAVNGPRSWVEYQCRDNMFAFFQCQAAGLPAKYQDVAEITPAMLEDLIKTGALKMPPEHPGDGPGSLDRYIKNPDRFGTMIKCKVHGVFEDLRDSFSREVSDNAAIVWSDLGSIAVALHKHDLEEPPFKGGSLQVLKPKYLQFLHERDPWGHDYIVDTTKGTITTLGKDGKPGGTGDDADLLIRYR